MQLTTKNIIKILPFEEKFREDLLGRFDTFDADQKFHAEQLLWKAYAAMYDILLQENIKIGLEEIKQGKEQMNEGFFLRMDEKTAKQMDEQSLKSAEHVDISSARHELEKIIKGAS